MTVLFRTRWGAGGAAGGALAVVASGGLLVALLPYPVTIDDSRGGG